MARHSRRDLFKTGGIVAGGAVAAGLLAGPARALTTPSGLVVPQASPSGSPWDQVPTILAQIKPPTFPDKNFDVTAFGAKGDGKTDDSAAFTKAIAAANKAGGGHVVVPAGSTFLTGAVTLLSNVDLHVLGTVKFSTDTKKYPLVFSRWQGIECMNFSPFIYAFGQTNVAVTGTGTLDGQGPSGPWPGWASNGNRNADWTKLQQMAVDGVDPHKRIFGQGHKLAPSFIQFYSCTNVLIEGVHLKNSAMWNIHPVLSKNVTIRNVNVLSRGATVDGCDPEACDLVHVTGCSFDTGDDGVVIKSGRDIDGRRVGVPCSNVVIENNQFLGRWGAITVGSEMSGGVKNVFAQNNTIKKGSSYTSFYAVYIKTNNRRGGTVDGIHVRNLHGGPESKGGFFIDMNYSLTGPGFGPIVHPKVQNIDIDGLVLDGAPFAIKLSGDSSSHIKNVTVSNSTFTNMASSTISVKNADNVTFTNVKVNGKTIKSP
jgi:polygalacturonase